MLSTLPVEVHELAPLVAPLWVFAAVPAAIFLIMGLVTFSYRDVANRHAQRSAKRNPDDHGHISHGPSGAAH